MDTQYYRKFFGELAVNQMRTGASADKTRAEADLLVHELTCPPGARILDIPCGRGQHTVEMAGRGFHMTGVDRSEAAIREAGLQSPAGSSIEWLCADMLDLEWEAEFDGAFCFGNSFGCLEHNEMQRFLRNVVRALKPGAYFVIQTNMAAESIIPSFREKSWHEVDDALLAVSNDYRAGAGRIETECIFHRSPVVERKRFSRAVYTAAEIQRMLGAAGLRTRALYGSHRREPFKLGAPSLYLVTQKRP